MLDLEKAKQELAGKSINDIQTETAWTWASRACVSYQNSVTSQGSAKLSLWSLGLEYEHEALEHAALVEGMDLVKEVKNQVESYREQAASSIDELFQTP
jgi:hypothetical protein